MDKINTFIKPGEIYSEPVEYVLRLIGINQSIRFNFLQEKGQADLVFDNTDPEHSIPIAVEFYEKLLKGKLYAYTNYFREECVVVLADGEKDLIATAFYVINCFQEYSANPGSLDKFDRFIFEDSYQNHYNKIEENLVQGLFETFCQKYISRHLFKSRKTRIFVSHDIDTINGALLQDGYWALRHKRPDVILKLIFNAFLLHPDWKNMDQIMRINDEYSLKSTFFWIVNNKKGEEGIKNADYRIGPLKPLLESIEKKGYFNGLHKSYSSLSFKEEINRFPLPVKYNRNHFIHYKLPELWDSLVKTGIEADFSLGFAQSHGFRNNYGLPFAPYNLKTKSSYPFIVVPLNIMDTTFHKYKKCPVAKTADTIIAFIEKNLENAVLSLLWHNIYFTDYKYHGYLEEYKKVLGYCYEKKINNITPPEIVKEFAYGE
jgi:hypothetical protein